jgi:catechol 2,3-dioxygenase-like lactoylglutathione lyase family enzyme
VIKGLHHNAYRCRDSEETRRFYEDFLGLPLANAFVIRETKSGRRTAVLHSFYRMDDGSCLAFFEAPDRPFEFKPQHDYDLHIALEVEKESLGRMLEKGKAAGVEVRGVADHGFIHSIYFRDPNGYVIELTAKHGDHERAMDPAANGARRELDVVAEAGLASSGAQPPRRLPLGVHRAQRDQRRPHERAARRRREQRRHCR